MVVKTEGVSSSSGNVYFTFMTLTISSVEYKFNVEPNTERASVQLQNRFLQCGEYMTAVLKGLFIEH